MDNISDRLRKLERNNRIWRSLFLVILACVSYVIFFGPQKVHSQELIQSAKVLPPLQDSHRDLLVSEKLVTKELLAQKISTKSVSLTDSQGKVRMVLAIDEKDQPQIVLNDKEGRARGTLMVLEDGRGIMVMKSEDGKEAFLAAERTDKEGGIVRVGNASGKPVAALTTDKDANGMLTVTKKDGSRPIGLGFW